MTIPRNPTPVSSPKFPMLLWVGFTAAFVLLVAVGPVFGGLLV
jgi:hypothetical protein